jgi:putative transposase
MRYRRLRDPGAAYFFTVVTCGRRPIFSDPAHVGVLRTAFRHEIQRHPFVIDAFVLLPDHLHTIWTLPEHDSHDPMRWRHIKAFFSRYCDTAIKMPPSQSRARKAEQAIWQRRYWEHQIRDDRDSERMSAISTTTRLSMVWSRGRRTGRIRASTDMSVRASTRPTGAPARILPHCMA